MNELARTLKLSPTEWQAMEDRLLQSDCIAEALTDTDDPAEVTYDPQDVEDVAEMLARGNLSEALAYSECITHDVLEDAITGSVWAAAQTDEPSHVYAAACRALRGAAAKVGKYLGRQIVAPME